MKPSSLTLLVCRTKHIGVTVFFSEMYYLNASS